MTIFGKFFGKKAVVEEVPGKVITLEQLQDMFSNIESQGQWNTKGELLWGYFFINSETSALEVAKERLVKSGYKFVDLYPADKEDTDSEPKYWLHVEKREIHTPESLDQRNNELYRLAYELGLDSYDGMDVGPVPH